MSIKDLVEKIKQGRGEVANHERGLYFALLVVVLTTLSFGLGRLSVVEQNREPVRIELPALASAPVSTGEGSKPYLTPASATKASNPGPNVKTGSSAVVVASRSGTKYHFPYCGSAKTIKPENLITFPSEAAAQSAGYTLAKNCKK